MQPRRILVADDDRNLLDSMAFSLRRRGYAVTCVGDGVAAFEAIGAAQAANKAFDTVIADVIMPGLDGLNLLQKVRDAGIAVPMIIITAYLHAELLDSLRKAGTSAVLGKPFSFDELDEAIRTALAGSHA